MAAISRDALPPPLKRFSSSSQSLHTPSTPPPLPASLDLVFSCRLQSDLVEAIRSEAASHIKRTSMIANNLVGGTIGGLSGNAEVVLVMWERRSAAASSKVQLSTSTSTSTGEPPADKSWLWFEVGRTEVAEVKVCSPVPCRSGSMLIFNTQYWIQISPHHTLLSGLYACGIHCSSAAPIFLATTGIPVRVTHPLA